MRAVTLAKLFISTAEEDDVALAKAWESISTGSVTTPLIVNKTRDVDKENDIRMINL